MWSFQATQISAQTTEWFRDPAWQFIGVVVAIVSLIMTVVLTIYIYRRQNKQKSLSYEIRSFASLINVDSQIKHALKITYKNTPVSDLKLLLIRFTNSGELPIEEDDFKQPLVVNFDQYGALFDVAVVDTYPHDVQKTIDIALYDDLSAFQALPMLLNKGDWFEIKLLLNGVSSLPSVSARIIGISELTNITDIGKNSIGIFNAKTFLLILFFSSILVTVTRLLPEELIITPFLLSMAILITVNLTMIVLLLSTGKINTKPPLSLKWFAKRL